MSMSAQRIGWRDVSTRMRGLSVTVIRVVLQWLASVACGDYTIGRPTTNRRSGREAAVEREAMEYDVVIVGAGPAGLAAAIRLKQLAARDGRELGVCVLEKASAVGAHILSGAVMDPRALTELLPEWKTMGVPLETPVTDDRFLILSEHKAWRIPHALLPRLMSNHGMYIASLENVCLWLGTHAESLGVE